MEQIIADTWWGDMEVMVRFSSCYRVLHSHSRMEQSVFSISSIEARSTLFEQDVFHHPCNRMTWNVHVMNVTLLCRRNSPLFSKRKKVGEKEAWKIVIKHRLPKSITPCCDAQTGQGKENSAALLSPSSLKLPGWIRDPTWWPSFSPEFLCGLLSKSIIGIDTFIG